MALLHSLREMCCPLLRITSPYYYLVRGLSASSQLNLARKERESVLKEEGRNSQKEYRDDVRKLVTGFRQERLNHEQQRKAAEGEQQKRLQLEREVQERVIEDVTLENERLAMKRARRLSFKCRRKDQLNLRREEAMTNKYEELREERIAIVKQAIEESKDFVTPDNLEEKIVYALEHETNYNFALTPDGGKKYSHSPPGNLNTELYAPGPAAYIHSPTAWKEWSNLTNEDTTELKNKTPKQKLWQNKIKGKRA